MRNLRFISKGCHSIFISVQGIFGSINRIIRKPAGVLFVNSMSEIADQSAPLGNSLGSTNKEREILNRIIKIGMPAELTKDKYKARSSGGSLVARAIRAWGC